MSSTPRNQPTTATNDPDPANTRPADRSEWMGVVRYGAPPPPRPPFAPTVPTVPATPKIPKIPTPAELEAEMLASLEEVVVTIVAKVLDDMRQAGLRSAVKRASVGHASKRALEEAARRLRAAGWKCKVLSSTLRDPAMLTVSDVCPDCGGGGIVGHGPQESPCSCQSRTSEFQR